MNLKLENIGIVKRADINIDGLTVIAGENDTGKSTVGKVLYSIIKSISKNKNIPIVNIQNSFNKYFERQLSDDGNIEFQDGNLNLNITVLCNKCTLKNLNEDEVVFSLMNYDRSNIIMVETPLVWNLMDLLTKLPLIENAMDIELEYPQVMKDLHFYLSFKSKKIGIDISNSIKNLIQGDFLKYDNSKFYFQKNNSPIKLINTATGIKYFGILQVLSNNNHLYDGQLLILDEPEVHLHPKWQLKLAELVISLVKEGMKIIVNSHSPYMIEALQRYSEREKIEDKTNFYLAEDGVIDKIENSNSRTLSEIFEKLSEPYYVFEKMESDRF